MKKSLKSISLILVFVFVLSISVNVLAANVSCTGVFSGEFLQALRNYVYIPIKWLTPVILLVLTSFDFAKVVFAGKKEEMDKAKNNFLKRSVAALIVFFSPNIIILLAELLKPSVSTCINGYF